MAQVKLEVEKGKEEEGGKTRRGTQCTKMIFLFLQRSGFRILYVLKRNYSSRHYLSAPSSPEKQLS